MSQLLELFLDAASRQYQAANTMANTFVVEGTKVFLTDGLEDGSVLMYAPLPQIPNECVDNVNAHVLRDQYRFRETDGGTIAMGPAGIYAFQKCIHSCENPVFLAQLKSFALTAAEWTERLTELTNAN